MSPYERLIGDALEGVQSLFATEEAIETQWRIVEGVLGLESTLVHLSPGTWGPPERIRSLQSAGDGWSHTYRASSLSLNLILPVLAKHAVTGPESLVRSIVLHIL